MIQERMLATQLIENELGIPKRQRLIQATGDRSGWASHYGGLRELVTHAGLMNSLPVPFDATWQHGVVEPWRYQRYPLKLLYGIRHKQERLILVFTGEQRAVLEELGYSNVHAIGAPFVYAEPIDKPKRRSDSVLVMPPHSLVGAPFEDQSQIDNYVAFVANKYKNSGNFLCASIHAACIENNQWVSEFKKMGIGVVGGANHGDANSLKRMWHLFSLFDVVTTPDIGSHVFYALACGCKVVIEGPEILRSESQGLKDLSYRRSLMNGEDVLNDQQLKAAKKKFTSAFGRCYTNESLGKEILGFDCKKSPEEICEILGWSKSRQLQMAPKFYVKLLSKKISSVVRRARKRFGS